MRQTIEALYGILILFGLSFTVETFGKPSGPNPYEIIPDNLYVSGNVRLSSLFSTAAQGLSSLISYRLLIYTRNVSGINVNYLGDDQVKFSTLGGISVGSTDYPNPATLVFGR